jgi:hypothetical protein
MLDRFIGDYFSLRQDTPGIRFDRVSVASRLRGSSKDGVLEPPGAVVFQLKISPGKHANK